MALRVAVVLTLAFLSVAALHADAQGGPFDRRFGPQSGHFRPDRPSYDESAQDLAVDSQGRIYVAFRWRDPGGPGVVWWPALYRLTPDGTPDATFGLNGFWQGDIWPAAHYRVQVAVDDQDRPVVGWTLEQDDGSGPDRTWVVRRLHPAGNTDTEAFVGFAWGSSRKEQLEDLLVLDDGRVVAVGTVDYDIEDRDFAIAVFVSNGIGGLILDPTFSGDGRREIAFDLPGGSRADRAYSALEDGSSLWVAGDAFGASSSSWVAVARVDLSTGALDGGFGSGGKATYAHTPLLGTTWHRHHVADVASRPGGGLILAGFGGETPSSWTRVIALAIDSVGVEVPGWGSLGWYTPDLRYPGYPLTSTFSGTYGVAVDPSGRALLVGDLGDPMDTDQARAVAIRLTALGAPDPTFSTDGVESYALESTGPPWLDGFEPVLFTDETKMALVGGWTHGSTSGVPRSDLDLFVARLILDPTIFADGFETGDDSRWAQ